MPFIEVDLDEFDDDEIIQELKYRKQQDVIEAIEQGNARIIVDHLKKEGCPESILSPLEAWLRQPVADADKLQRWKEPCEESV